MICRAEVLRRCNQRRDRLLAARRLDAMREKYRNGCSSTETSLEDEVAHVRGLDLKGLRAQ